VDHGELFPDMRGVVGENRGVKCRRGPVDRPHYPTLPFNRLLPLVIGSSHFFGDCPNDLDLRRLDNATRFREPCEGSLAV
jgi:hypothetical protein